MSEVKPLLNISLVKDNVAAFSQKVVDVSAKLGIKPDWLMQVMKQESSLNPKAINTYTKAVGLIQFMPSTAVSLGTTTAAIYALNNVNQLDYVYKYLKPYAPKIKSFVDLYLTILFPVAVGKPLDYVLETKTLHADTIARMNPIYDLNGDQKVTVKEIRDALIKKIDPSYLSEFIDTVKNNPLTVIAVLVIAGFLIFND